ncbi:molybdopterin-guanine dinucleotide biosynthesis protein B [Accumulibacter sp.]|uniref:molybdopterin-guanine dinucleotide biosynthesis protein B n=1 Tax=Accumulibacter sp. TaxID=2053492 RepID=UPI0025D858B7|nr:molybdopterin-guanine dinucleotide biosynthesis protein B [Accumulibacter sp.]MCM8626305.1 molybdopterin-guanine dinucleotide biosynthesis protein B [Accumulibacter sp.]
MKLIGIAGHSGSGKTTLIEKPIALLNGQGLRVSVLKHAHHDVDVDRPGKDSYRHRQAGAAEVLLAAGARWALLHELCGEREPTLAECASRFSPCGLILVEGFEQEAIPRIEVHRPLLGRPLLWPDDAHVAAVASDAPPVAELPARIAWLDLDDVPAIARFIVDPWGFWQSAGEEGASDALC